MDILIKEWSSVVDTWDYAHKVPTSKHNQQVWESVKAGELRNSAKDWYGKWDMTIEDVYATANHGWTEGGEKIKAFAETLRVNVPAPHSIRRRIKWADQGDSLDIHRVWAGRLDSAWESHPRQRSANGQQTVSLFTQVSLSGNDSADITFWRGAAILTLTDLLSEAGYNVEITAGNITENCLRNRDAIVALLVEVKPAIAQLDINALASTVALSGFSRVALFLAKANFAEESNAVVSTGMGMPAWKDSSKYKTIQKRIAEIRNREFDFDATDCQNEASATAWVKAAIAKLQGDSED